MASRGFKEVGLHAKPALCLWRCAGAGHSPACRGPGKCCATDPSAAAASANPPAPIDQELAHLTRDLELTAKQQQQARPLLEQHHDRIQALLDKTPTASREELGPQIHAISEETHREIHALLTDHQKELEKAMQLHVR
jgi:hypothetical protein